MLRNFGITDGIVVCVWIDMAVEYTARTAAGTVTESVWSPTRRPVSTPSGSMPH